MNRRHVMNCALMSSVASISGCYTLHSADTFEVAFDPIPAGVLASLSDADHALQILPLHVGDRSFSAYWDRGRDSKGVLVFFNGNGYGAEVAARRILVPARSLGLDLVVLNYFDRGTPVPTVTQMREVARALCDAARQLPFPAAQRVYVGGHSLGATFVLDVASNDWLAGAFAAAPMTTGIAMLHHQLPLTRFALLRADAEYRQLDNVALAGHVRTKILVVGSDGDKDLPPSFTQTVFSALPTGLTKRELILHGVSHAGYLAQREFWADVSRFFELPVRGDLVRYLSG
jgi:hypothetical protein